MRAFLYVAMLQALSAAALKICEVKCTTNAAGAVDISEIDKRYRNDWLVWITILESLLFFVMINARFRNTCVYVVALLLLIRVHQKGIFSACLPDIDCPIQSESAFFFGDVCGIDSAEKKFTHVHFWSDSANMCRVPGYYNDCRRHQNQNTIDSSVKLKHVPDLYNCYIWGCSYEITPLRYGLKWVTTTLSLIGLAFAGFDSSKKMYSETERNLKTF